MDNLDYKVAPRLCKFRLGRHTVQIYRIKRWSLPRRGQTHTICDITLRVAFVGPLVIATLSQ